MSDPYTVEQKKALLDELSDLSKLQSAAFQDSVFIRMSRQEAALYESRRRRIAELCEITKSFRISPC